MPLVLLFQKHEDLRRDLISISVLHVEARALHNQCSFSNFKSSVNIKSYKFKNFWPLLSSVRYKLKLLEKIIGKIVYFVQI